MCVVLVKCFQLMKIEPKKNASNQITCQATRLVAFRPEEHYLATYNIDTLCE